MVLDVGQRVDQIAHAVLLARDVLEAPAAGVVAARGAAGPVLRCGAITQMSTT